MNQYERIHNFFDDPQDSQDRLALDRFDDDSAGLAVARGDSLRSARLLAASQTGSVALRDSYPDQVRRFESEGGPVVDPAV